MDVDKLNLQFQTRTYSFSLHGQRGSVKTEAVQLQYEEDMKIVIFQT